MSQAARAAFHTHYSVTPMHLHASLSPPPPLLLPKQVVREAFTIKEDTQTRMEAVMGGELEGEDALLVRRGGCKAWAAGLAARGWAVGLELQGVGCRGVTRHVDVCGIVYYTYFTMLQVWRPRSYACFFPLSPPSPAALKLPTQA